MARFRKVSKNNPRRKKFEHFTMRFRHYIFRLSVLLNLITILYLLHQDGKLTNIYEQVSPIVETLIKQLPL